jgi:hypothetical protein
MTNQERIYSVLPRWNLVILLVPGVLLVAVLVFAVFGVVTGQLEFFRRYGMHLGILLVVLLLMLRPLLTLSHSIVVRSESVVFRGLRRERVVVADKAQALRPATSLQGTFEVLFEGGRATFFSRFTGFHEVVLALKSQNLRMTIEKC